MNIKRLPTAFLMIGLVLKTLLVLLWRFWKSPGLLNLLIYYDPVSRYFAERMTRLFFDYKGITMATGAPVAYEIFLIIGFGVECLIVGLVLQWLLKRPLAHRAGHREAGA